MIVQPLSNLQEELLKLFSNNIPENELIEVKSLLGKYFGKKATSEADEIWANKEYSNEKMDSWLNEE